MKKPTSHSQRGQPSVFARSIWFRSHATIPGCAADPGWRKMKALVSFLFAAVLAGCVGYQPDQRVVGIFHGPAGEVLDIMSDGRIAYVAAGREELVGLVTVDGEAPLRLRVIAPDTSPLVGTKIVFSEDRGLVSVEWQDWKRAGAVRPREFRKKEPIQAPATARGGKP